jgi:protein required for attachment to host cells
MRAHARSGAVSPSHLNASQRRVGAVHAGLSPAPLHTLRQDECGADVPKIWILVADRARARLFSGNSDRSLTEIETRFNPEGRAQDRELVTDRASRMPEMASRPRGAIEPRSAEDHVAERFARELAETLERGRTQGAYERLALIAPPEFLGFLHGAAGEQVARRVAAEVNKNLTERSADEIRGYLPDRLWSDLAG